MPQAASQGTRPPAYLPNDWEASLLSEILPVREPTLTLGSCSLFSFTELLGRNETFFFLEENAVEVKMVCIKATEEKEHHRSQCKQKDSIICLDECFKIHSSWAEHGGADLWVHQSRGRGVSVSPSWKWTSRVPIRVCGLHPVLKPFFLNNCGWGVRGAKDTVGPLSMQRRGPQWGWRKELNYADNSKYQVITWD